MMLTSLTARGVSAQCPSSSSTHYSLFIKQVPTASTPHIITATTSGPLTRTPNPLNAAALALRRRPFLSPAPQTGSYAMQTSLPQLASHQSQHWPGDQHVCGG
jgi:hypothetical protein